MLLRLVCAGYRHQASFSLLRLAMAFLTIDEVGMSRGVDLLLVRLGMQILYETGSVSCEM